MNYILCLRILYYSNVIVYTEVWLQHSSFYLIFLSALEFGSKNQTGYIKVRVIFQSEILEEKVFFAIYFVENM